MVTVARVDFYFTRCAFWIFQKKERWVLKNNRRRSWGLSYSSGDSRTLNTNGWARIISVMRSITQT